jgi:hypothetical protein
MSSAEWKDFAKPDEVRTFPHGRIELLHIGGGTAGRMTLEPSWRWSTDVKPIAAHGHSLNCAFKPDFRNTWSTTPSRARRAS